MKYITKNYFLLFFCFVSTLLYSQTDKVGLFKTINVKAGLSLTYYHNFQGEYVYILQQNARVVEDVENTNGSSVLIVLLFPLDKNEKFNISLNLALLDIKNENNSTSQNTTILNSQAPFGFGISILPFNQLKWLGFTAMLNIGKQKRLRESAIDNQFFPIADYPNYNLKVGAPVPEAVLEPFFYKETTLSVNFGIVIRL